MQLKVTIALRSLFFFVLLISVSQSFPNQVVAQPETTKRRMVILEISATAGAAIGTQQQWVEMLQDVGASKVTSRTGRAGVPAITETESSRSTVITVTGYIVGNRLKLPGGSFSLRDKARIRELIQRLRDDGAQVALAEKKAFGLTSEQLVAVHQAFSGKVEFETAGQNAGSVVGKLTAKSGLKFTLDGAARAAFNSDDTVGEELNGMSIGTALAVIIRPLGLVLVPRREQGKSLEVQIVDSRGRQENWPIGWPIEKSPFSIEPKLFERIPIEIRGFPMKDALDAVRKRADVPFFYDWNTLAREGIEMDELKVTVVEKKASLMVVISKILRQSKPRMSDELRVDENGKPFLWISVR